MSILVFLSQIQNQAFGQKNNRPGLGQGKYALDIGGNMHGWVGHAEGGNAMGEVIVESAGQETLIKKSLGAVKYEDLTLTVGGNMSKEFYQWIKDSLEGKAAPKTFSIISVDNAYREKSRRIFHDTLISDVQFPKLNSQTNDDAFITIKFLVSKSQRVSGKGVQLPKPSGPKQTAIAQFRLKIEGVDGSSAQASELDSFAIKLFSSASPLKSDKDNKPGTRAVQYSDLSFALPEAAAAPFFALEESFIIKGENTDREEKTGTISYMSSDQTELFSLELGGLGLIKVAPDPLETSVEKEKGRPVKAEMYCEDIRFHYHGAGSF